MRHRHNRIDAAPTPDGNHRRKNRTAQRAERCACNGKVPSAGGHAGECRHDRRVIRKRHVRGLPRHAFLVHHRDLEDHLTHTPIPPETPRGHVSVVARVALSCQTAPFVRSRQSLQLRVAPIVSAARANHSGTRLPVLTHRAGARGCVEGDLRVLHGHRRRDGGVERVQRMERAARPLVPKDILYELAANRSKSQTSHCNSAATGCDGGPRHRSGSRHLYKRTRPTHFTTEVGDALCTP
eukprot:1179311-Prorocentrum_minimum.AAC.10